MFVTSCLEYPLRLASLIPDVSSLETVCDDGNATDSACRREENRMSTERILLFNSVWSRSNRSLTHGGDFQSHELEKWSTFRVKPCLRC